LPGICPLLSYRNTFYGSKTVSRYIHVQRLLIVNTEIAYRVLHFKGRHFVDPFVYII
jgi:hypothetical protein